MQPQNWINYLILVGYFLLIITFALAIVMKRRPIGVSLSWLVLLFALPLVGMILYLLLGSQFLGKRRLKKARNLYPDYHKWRVSFSRLFIKQFKKFIFLNTSGLHQFIENSMGIPALPGNNLKLFSENIDMLDCIMLDIAQAQDSIVLQFYILSPEGKCKNLIHSLIEAQKRGVNCKILVDAVGSRYFLNHPIASLLKNAGVELESSLPVGIIRMFFERIDVRNHRKIVVIDEKIAWTGSFNLVDPAYFKQNLQIGQWVDAMLRVEGPSAYIILMVFFWDWQFSTGKKATGFSEKHNTYNHNQSQGSSSLHVLPSNPHFNRDRLHLALLTAIYQSKKKIIITTPYFVPDDSLFSSLISAAKRGVDVQIILPKTTDSRIARFASRSYYQPLLESGARIFLFTEGLLHTKCVLVDNETVLFGTVNMDMRSVWLNMELTLVVYDKVFSKQIEQMITSYLSRSMELNLARWKHRSFFRKLGESLAQLASPLL